ncbi:MAG: RsmD family RNA methyltransferase [Weeksellaceae bacterium]|jgi:16S rRNA G966 N2-methylase RsmD|nr:RsmD family RNA methyltransferase [Weeksellaceae bacterium]
MFNPFLLNKEVQFFLNENATTDFRVISLQKSKFKGIHPSELAEQLKGKQIAKSKFPLLYETPNIFYPPSLNLEQSSSQITAFYKSNLISAKSMIDLTAGMGIDAYFFAQKVKKIVAIEQNKELVEICQHNYKTLNQSNLTYIHQNFSEFFKENPTEKWDLIYLDPARRKNAKKKFLLEDLEPNILNWMNIFFEKSPQVMIKLSPLMDIYKVITQIPFIQEIHLIAVKNEMKEMLLICRKTENQNPLIKAVNLETEQKSCELYFEEESSAKADYSIVKSYLYEPNSALMKSGAFKWIAQKFHLFKLEINTHLYTSNELKSDFPGKIYEVKEELKNEKQSLKNGKFHVVAKNYPLKTEEIRKKYHLKEGEGQSLFFIKTQKGLQHFLCHRIK